MPLKCLYKTGNILILSENIICIFHLKTFWYSNLNLNPPPTNENPSAIAARYGNHIGDRLPEMFNIIKWEGKSWREWYVLKVLSTFPFISILPKRDARYCRESTLLKRSWTQAKKLIPSVTLIRESQKKSGAEMLHSGNNFLAWVRMVFTSFHVLYLPEPFGTLPC